MIDRAKSERVIAQQAIGGSVAMPVCVPCLPIFAGWASLYDLAYRQARCDASRLLWVSQHRPGLN